jgi:capsule polysaccharide export protein KpsE/RkpR
VSDNVLQTVQKLVQDVIAPDVRELKVRLESLEKQNDTRFTALERQGEAQFKGLLAAIAESRAQSELAGMTAMAALRERVAVLESKHN